MNYYTDISELELKNNIIAKVFDFCGSKGEIKYKEIDYKHNSSYGELDILSKKALCNKLKNSILRNKIDFLKFDVTLVTDKTDINEILHKNDFKHKYGLVSYNEYFLTSSSCCKLYKDSNYNDEINFIKDIETLETLKIYLDNIIINYSMAKELPIPFVDFSSKFLVESVLYNYIISFSPEEIKYMLNIISRKVYHYE